MRRWTFTIAALAAALSPASAHAIVGGQPARGQAPFAVSISDDAGQFCTGSVIAPRLVLTAAHCVADVPEITEVRVRHRSLHTRAVRRITHPRFDARTLRHDLALIQTRRAFRARPARLHGARRQPAGSLTVAGYGISDPYASSSDGVLRIAEVTLLPDDSCATQDPFFSPRIMLCAGRSDGTADSCRGDSGGPLLSGTGRRRVLVGVTSSGMTCNGTGAYVRVAAERRWIDRAVRELTRREPRRRAGDPAGDEFGS